jgi:hypothetical protein
MENTRPLITDLFGVPINYILPPEPTKPPAGYIRIRIDYKTFTKKILRSVRYPQFYIKDDILFFSHSEFDKQSRKTPTYLIYRSVLIKYFGEQEAEKVIMHLEDKKKEVYSFISNKNYKLLCKKANNDSNKQTSDN